MAKVLRDRAIADLVRKSGRRHLLAVNKTEGMKRERAVAEFSRHAAIGTVPDARPHHRLSARSRGLHAIDALTGEDLRPARAGVGADLDARNSSAAGECQSFDRMPESSDR